jgi:hypothetical protein
MKPDYLTLDNGRSVRILWNMNALNSFTEQTGKELTSMVDGRVDVSTLRAIAWCAAIEGEEADGNTLGLNEKEFGRLITMNGIVEFSQILSKQSGDGQKKNPEQKGQLPRIFFRKRG